MAAAFGLRELALLGLFFLPPGMAAAQPAAAPQVSGQSAPLGKFLDDIKTAARQIGGDDAVKKVDAGLKEALGDKGFTGVDLTRRAVFYATVAEDAEKSSGVLAVPVTGEDEFKDFLTRVGKEDERLKVAPVEGKAGLYAVESPKGGEKVPVRLRFADRYAYVGFNVPDAELDAKKLLPAAGLIDPKETALVAYRTKLDAYPAGTKKKAIDQLDKAAAQAAELPAPPAVKKALENLVGAGKRLTEQLLDQGDEALYRMRFDPETTELAYETALRAKPGTKLAADLAARKPTTNQFAALLTDETAVGFTTRLPLFFPAVRELATAALDEAGKMAGQGAVPLPYQPAADEALKGVARTVNTGKFDLAGAVVGPDAQGKFTVSVGVAFDDPAKLEKELRALHENAPDQFKGLIQLDFKTVGKVAVHQSPVGLFLPEPAKAVFGGNATLLFAFAPNGILVTFGPKAMDAMTAAINARPAEAKVLDVVVNPNRLGKLVTAANAEAGEAAGQLVGTADRKVSVVYLTVEGGEELRVRFGANVKAFAGFGQTAAGAAPAP